MGPCGDFAALVEQALRRPAERANALVEAERQVLALHGQGNSDHLVAPLQGLCAGLPDEAQAWWLLGLVLHDVQQHEEALVAMERAAALRPDPGILHGLAQLCYETGRPAAARFAALQRDRPDDPQLLRKLSGALAAEGDPRAAEAVLGAALARRPGWLEGQQLLATLRQTAGWVDFAGGYAEAVRREPANPGLRLGWFAELAKARLWDAARRVVDDARRELGERPALRSAALYLDAESGAADQRPDLFEGLAAVNDPGLGLARVRHALRCGQPDRAADIATAFVATPAAPMFWPYLSIAWRLLGDARAEWLDRPGELIGVTTLDLDPGTLAELATLLRSLHTMAAPYLEQSVRGGTQTDRPLLFRHEPVMARLRAAILTAVRAYVDALPSPEPGHPLLGAPRERLRFAGSWSVRLRDQGFHACHTHPAGWISSACYIVLPEHMGTAPAGWLQLGTPPPELKLGLAPYREIQPRVSQLVLFPSTLWHGTVPFSGGERLTVAFDMKREIDGDVPGHRHENGTPA